MHQIRLEGTAQAMGEAFGDAFRREIQELYRLRLDNAISQALQYGGRHVREDELLKLASRCLDACEAFDAEGHAELMGIARGSELAPKVVLAMNGLTDLRDVLAWGGRDEEFGGCTALLVQSDRTQDRSVRVGQTWDLGTSNQPFVVAVHRVPKQGPETWSVTTVGCLSLMGLSETGIAIATTNLRTTDARPGVPYLNVIHRALNCQRAREVVDLVRHAPRAGAHSYLVGDAGGQAAVLECSATRSQVRWLRSGFEVQTNHCLAAENRELEAATPRASSEARLERMRTLLGSAGRIDQEKLATFFGDREGGALAINRDDFDGISTNAAFVAAPGLRQLHACRGAPDKAEWSRMGPGPKQPADQEEGSAAR